MLDGSVAGAKQRSNYLIMLSDQVLAAEAIFSDLNYPPR